VSEGEGAVSAGIETGWLEAMEVLFGAVFRIFDAKDLVSGSGSAREAFELTPRLARELRQTNCAEGCVLA
jgi:hypothetical protein